MENTDRSVANDSTFAIKCANFFSLGSQICKGISKVAKNSGTILILRNGNFQLKFNIVGNTVTKHLSRPGLLRKGLSNA